MNRKKKIFRESVKSHIVFYILMNLIEKNPAKIHLVVEGLVRKIYLLSRYVFVLDWLIIMSTVVKLLKFIFLKSIVILVLKVSYLVSWIFILPKG